MAIKKELTVEELRKQCLEAEKNFKNLNELLIQAEKEEEEAKRVKFEAERQLRYDAVVDAYKKFEELRSEYVDDYGKFTFHAECKDGDMCEWIFKTFGLI